MKNIGVFGTCRIDNFNIEDFKQTIKMYPFVYQNGLYKINVRPLGYSTTSSDILQNLKLVKNKEHLKIKENYPIYKNVFLKHKGKYMIEELNYSYLVLEICSIKKIIYKPSNLIFPYVVEFKDKFQEDDFCFDSEDFQETINNIYEIQKLMKCKIILLPPVIEFAGDVIKGTHENTDISIVLLYRKDILDRLTKCAEGNENIDLIDWNLLIKKYGINKMLEDQFHFTIFGKKIISKTIYNHIKLNISS